MKATILAVISCLFALTGSSQTLLGQLGSDNITEAPTAVNVNDNPIIYVISAIPHIVVDSKNRRILKSWKESEGRLAIAVAPGTHKLVFDARGYERLELDNFVFAKRRAYAIKVFEVRPPRGGASPVGKGSITINTDPAGATITMDGLPGEYKSPKSIENIIATTYNITVYKEKYDSSIVSATVIRDSIVTLPTIKLVPQFGFLGIVSDTSAQLAIDSRPVHYTRDSVMELPRGRHSITLAKKRYQTYSEDIPIVPGDTTHVKHSLIPAFAFFDLSKIQYGSSLLLDDLSCRRALVETTPGNHSISVEDRIMGKVTRTFVLLPGETRIINDVDLRDPGDLVVTSDAPAQLFIDDTVAVLSALKKNVPSGVHTIRLVQKEFGEKNRTIQIMPNIRNDVFITMRPSRSIATLLTIVPGARQMYNGMTTKGLFYLGGFAISIAGLFYFNSEFDRHNSDYNSSIEEYRTTTDGLRAAALNSLITTSYPELTKVRNQRQVALGIVAAIALWNIVDAFLFEPQYGYRDQEDSVFDFRLDSEHQQVAVGVYVTF